MKRFEASGDHLAYMPQLDSLRFFAVLLVMIEHWIPEENTGGDYSLGYTGVTFFFVLSGFLISKILLRNKQKSEENGVGKRSTIKSFFIRRSLRIFPVYYACILVLMALPMGENIRDNAGYYLFYLNNFLMYSQQEWPIIAHTWTLAVEEQFYLLWPWVILFTPFKHLKKVFLVFVAIGFISYIASYIFSVLTLQKGLAQGFYVILTPVHFDAFGLGALLALFQLQNGKPYHFLSKWAGSLLVATLLIWGFFLYLQDPNGIFYTKKICILIISACFVFLASRGFGGMGKLILENPGIIYLGKISYGLYLFHFIVPFVYDKIARRTFIHEVWDPGMRFVIFFIITTGVSVLSWHLFEKPINDLKKYFSYTPSKLITAKKSD